MIKLCTDLGGDQLLLPNVVRAVGQALVMTPLATLAVAGIAVVDKASASTLLNVLRNLGGAFGIAVLQTFLIRREHFHSSTLAQSVSLFDEVTCQRIDQLVHLSRAMVSSTRRPRGTRPWPPSPAASSGRPTLWRSATSSWCWASSCWWRSWPSCS